MSAYGYDNVTVTLYKYRPSTSRALLSLVRDESKKKASRFYFADLLRICALGNLSSDARIPTLREYLTPKDNTSAYEIRQQLIQDLKKSEGQKSEAF